MPASRASSTTCWMSGRSTTVSISFGTALVAGRNRVPRPATGNIALRIGDMAERFLKSGVSCERQALLCRQNPRGFQGNEMPMRADTGQPGEDAAAGPGGFACGPLTCRPALARNSLPIGIGAGSVKRPETIAALNRGDGAAESAGEGRGHMGKRGIQFAKPAGGICGTALMAAVVACAVTAAPVRAQLQEERAVLVRGEVTGTLPASRGWRGEAGGSGHPLIIPQPFQAYTGDLEPDLHIMDLLDAQPEFTKSLWDYLDLLVNDARIAAGREILAKYQPVFAAVEKAYGVDRHVIAAIWGIESNFGSAIGERPVLQSTATLACIGRRQD